MSIQIYTNADFAGPKIDRRPSHMAVQETICSPKIRCRGRVHSYGFGNWQSNVDLGNS